MFEIGREILQVRQQPIPIVERGLQGGGDVPRIGIPARSFETMTSLPSRP